MPKECDSLDSDSPRPSTDIICRDVMWERIKIDDTETIFRSLYIGLQACSMSFRHLFLQQGFNQNALISCAAHLFGYEIFVQSYCRAARLGLRKKIQKLLAKSSYDDEQKMQDILYDAGLFPNDFR